MWGGNHRDEAGLREAAQTSSPSRQRPARRHHTPRAAAPGPGSDQNRLDNQRPGQARPRLSDQFITSERRPRRWAPGPRRRRHQGPRCTAPGAGFAGGELFISGRPGGLGSQPDQIRSRCRRGEGRRGCHALALHAPRTLTSTRTHTRRTRHPRDTAAPLSAPAPQAALPPVRGRKSAPPFKRLCPAPRLGGFWEEPPSTGPRRERALLPSRGSEGKPCRRDRRDKCLQY